MRTPGNQVAISKELFAFLQRRAVFLTRLLRYYLAGHKTRTPLNFEFCAGQERE
jgi:hypothetical protein